jgi:DNA polymerase-1
VARYLVLDGHSLAFRAFFALQEAGMKTSSGQETHAVYGFVSMTTKLLGDFQPDGMAVAFDRHEPTFRDEIATDYKAGRPPTPDSLIAQVELIREFVQVLGVPGLDALGYEADDVLATLATRLSANDDDVIVVTGDRDAFQLVEDPHVRVLYNRRGVSDYVLYDEAGIIERTGVAPSKYPLLASLRGDPSDNLPGVPGVGEKTAAKLVSTYGNLDAIYAHLDELTPKLRASLAQSEDQVRKNLLLTPVVRDVPLRVELSELGLEHFDRDALARFFSFLEMRAPRDRLFSVLAKRPGGITQKTEPETKAIAEALIVRLDSKDAVLSFCEEAGRIAQGARITIEASFDGEPGRSRIEQIALHVLGAEEVALVPGAQLLDDGVRIALEKLFAAKNGGSARIVAHRAKELMRSLLSLGIDVTGLECDTAVVAYLVDPSHGSASLADLARTYGLPSTDEKESASGQLGFAIDDADEDRLDSTVARRTEVIEALGKVLEGELDAVGGRSLWEEVERPLVRVLAKMEVAGVGVDADRLRMINRELTEEAKGLEAEIQRHAGESFNVNSTIQLRQILYEKLRLAPGRKTKTGYSTDAATLEKLRDVHPIVDALLRYREVEKLRSTYGEGLLAEIAADGRIHASFNQTVARTGRLSSDQPNLHNIPVRSEDGRRFREAFVPAPGTLLLVADYNQIELRVIAHLSKDPGLVEAFAKGEDIHEATAARVFGVAPKDVTTQMRAKAKMVSYGLAYGMEAYGLAQRLAIPVDEAATILNQYFEAFPAVKDYMEQTVVEARRRGYTETERGRRRYLPELSSDNFRVRQAAERQAMNAGTQGLAADIFKIALVSLDASLEARSLSARIVLQVHDEVLVEAIPEEQEEVETLTLQAMNNAYPLCVPLEVHLAWGTSWADAK